MSLPANRKTASAPSSQERAAHREWIGGRAITLLSHYWRDDDPIELTAAIGADWADVLEGIPANIIQMAAIQYQREEPRRKPSPGAIYALCRALMPKPRQVPEIEPPRGERISADAAKQIMQEAGFLPRKFGGADNG